MYCNYLPTTKVTALQVVRVSFQYSFISGLPRQSLLLSLTSHGIDPEYMSMITCKPEGVKLSPLCPEKIGFLLLVPGFTDSKWNLKTGQCNAKTAHVD